LTPFESALAGRPQPGLFHARQGGEASRGIKTRGAFDTIIDFDRVIADPSGSAIASRYDSGGHLHPNDAGYRAMGEAVDLKLFQ
jgi:hypothetical protein